MTSIYRPPTAGRHKFKPSEYNSALSLIPETVCESDITLLGNTIVPENPRNWNLHDVLLNIPARQTFSNPEMCQHCKNLQANPNLGRKAAPKKQLSCCSFALSMIDETGALENFRVPLAPPTEDGNVTESQGWIPSKWPKLKNNMQFNDLTLILRTMIYHHCGTTRIRPKMFPKPSWYNVEIYPWTGSNFNGKDPRSQQDKDKIPKIVAVKMLIAAGYRYHGLQGKIPKIWTPNLS